MSFKKTIFAAVMSLAFSSMCLGRSTVIAGKTDPGTQFKCPYANSATRFAKTSAVTAPTSRPAGVTRAADGT